MKNNKNLAFLSMCGAMVLGSTFDPQASKQRLKIALNDEPKTPKKIIPNGCKEYLFTKTGSIYTKKPQGYEIVFECIASNDKSAKKKFDKWYFKNIINKI